MAATLNERLNFRLPREKKDAIERAAAIRGLSVTDFVVLTLHREAQKVLKSEQVTVLSNRDRDAFLAALDNPPKPSERLLHAADRYKVAREQEIIK